MLEQLADKVSPRILAAPRRLDEPRRELDQYFAGRRRHFDTPLDWRLTHGFTRRVLQATANVPYGATTTYKQVASEAGNALAFRAAGNALGANPIPIIVPCHRILHSGGGSGRLHGWRRAQAGVADGRGLQRVEAAVEHEQRVDHLLSVPVAHRLLADERRRRRRLVAPVGLHA